MRQLIVEKREVPKGQSMTVSAKIPKAAEVFFRELAIARSRLLKMRGVVDAALDSSRIQNNIDAIQRALKELDATNGRLELPYPISGLDLVLIWGAPESTCISSIVFENLDIQFRLDDFAIPRTRFLNLYGIECPDCLLMTFHLRERIEQFLGHGIELGYVSFEPFGLSTILLSQKDPPANALIFNKYGHHELNYVPYASYGSDAVTYGLLYDFYNGAFLTTAYHGDGEVSSYMNPLEPFVRKFAEPWKWLSARQLAGCFDSLAGDELVAALTDDDVCDRVDSLNALKNHTIACFIRAYLEVNPITSNSVPKDEQWRYESFMLSSERDALQSKWSTAYLFRETMPVTPIPLSLFNCTEWRAVDNWTAFVTCLAELHAAVCPTAGLMGILADGRYRNMRSWFREREPACVFDGNELKQYIEPNPKYRKGGKNILFGLLDAEIQKVYSVAKDMARTGAEGYAFVAAITFWNHCVDGRLSRLAVELLGMVSEPLCPAFIKRTAEMHASVRHDSYIPTWPKKSEADVT